MPVKPVLLADDGKAKAIPVHCLKPSTLDAAKKTLKGAQLHALTASGFTGDAGTQFLVVGDQGLESVFFGLGEDAGTYDPFLPGKLASTLPNGTYRFAKAPPKPELAALSFVLETYVYSRYRAAKPRPQPVLLYGNKAFCADIFNKAEAIFLARDLINTPANDLGPEELVGAVQSAAKDHSAKVEIIAGAKLEQSFPLIHGVGKGSARAPRLVDLTWGKASHPKVTLVGKGVVFDTGGLDIKPSSGMLMMKKDMGGAAATLALAKMIMAAKLPVRLRLLIPAVENSISGTSFRPSDIIKSRKGLTVEVGNTDAEGRLILADALAYAAEDKPELLIDMATLTGAARVALGPELPPFFTDDETLARDMLKAGQDEADPLWRLPLHKNYKAMLKSKIADMNNVSTTSFAGAITAALFLQSFVDDICWMHIDAFSWNAASTPGHPEGGEAQGIRALFSVLQKRYTSGS